MNYNFSKLYQMRKPVFSFKKPFKKPALLTTQKTFCWLVTIWLKSIYPFRKRGSWVSKLRGSNVPWVAFVGNNKVTRQICPPWGTNYLPTINTCIVNFKPIKLRSSWSLFKTKIVTKLAPHNSVLISMHKIKFGLRRIITLRGVGVAKWSGIIDGCWGLLRT